MLIIARILNVILNSFIENRELFEELLSHFRPEVEKVWILSIECQCIHQNRWSVVFIVYSFVAICLVCNSLFTGRLIDSLARLNSILLQK